MPLNGRPIQTGQIPAFASASMSSCMDVAIMGCLATKRSRSSSSRSRGLVYLFRHAREEYAESALSQGRSPKERMLRELPPYNYSTWDESDVDYSAGRILIWHQLSGLRTSTS
jgi:hypothetical protein